MAKKSKKQPKVVVNRSFMERLANRIYDPTTKKFMYMCDGTLQNGPDPTNAERPMHCGLGELYFAMTGHEPKDDGVDEDEVVNTAVELSTLPDKEKECDALKVRAVKGIKALKLPEDLESTLIDQVDNVDSDSIESAESDFRAALDSIPGANDDGCGDNDCSIKDFRSRSQRVAKKLREAAKLLPA